MDWRQWLDEKMLAVDLALDHLPATLSEEMTLIDETVRELSEGYKLLAEAVMAWEEYRNAALGSITEVGAVAKLREAHTKALALLAPGGDKS